jgi:hypothetical protein
VCASQLMLDFFTPSAPWAKIFRPFGAALAAHSAQPDLVNELLTQDASFASRV